MLLWTFKYEINFVYGINYRPELTGIGGHSGEMVKWFVDNDLDVRVITVRHIILHGRLLIIILDGNTRKKNIPEIVYIDVLFKIP